MTESSGIPGTPVNQERLAIATLAACLVRTFNETDPSFAGRFDAHLRDAHGQLNEAHVSNIGAMETLKWTSEIINRR